MAWIFLLEGHHYIKKNVDSDEASVAQQSIEEDPAFVAAAAKITENNLTLEFSTNDDDDSISCIVGKELHKGRHIYQGQTISSSSSGYLQSPLDQEINAALLPILEKQGFALVNSGIVLNQFD